MFVRVIASIYEPLHGSVQASLNMNLKGSTPELTECGECQKYKMGWVASNFANMTSNNPFDKPSLAE